MDTITIVDRGVWPPSACCSIFVGLGRAVGRQRAPRALRVGGQPTRATSQPRSAPSASASRARAHSPTSTASSRSATGAANLARELARADLALKPSEFLAIRAARMIGIPAVMIMLSPFIAAFGSPIAWVGGVVVGYWLPRFWLNRRKAKRLKAFNCGLADTITLLANSLRAGSSFLQSVEMVVREAQPPISTEFGRVIREVNLGLPLDEALANLRRRVRSDDLDLMTTAIAIHHQVGGNLAEILDSIAFTIRERVRIKGEIKTLTAQQRMSGYVVGFLPVALVLLLSVIAPTFMEPMFQQAARASGPARRLVHPRPSAGS